MLQWGKEVCCRPFLQRALRTARGLPAGEGAGAGREGGGESGPAAEAAKRTAKAPLREAAGKKKGAAWDRAPMPRLCFDVVLTDLRWPGGVRPSAPPCFEKMPGLPKAGKAPGRLWKTALPQGLGFEKGGNAAKEGGYTGRGRRLRKRPPPGGRGRRPGEEAAARGTRPPPGGRGRRPGEEAAARGKRPPPGGRGRRPACRRRAQSFFSASAAISFMCFGMSMCWGHLDRQVPQATQLSARWPASRA